MQKEILEIKEIRKEDVKEFGGKASSLGEMLSVGINVPGGFVLSTLANKKFLSDENYIKEIEEKILKTFDDLKLEIVAVRSSAIAEDSGTSSWAGQLESYLGVTRINLISSIKKCWESVLTERVKQYAKATKTQSEDLLIAVVVQKMVKSDFAGVAFSVNPINSNRDEIMIEACYGVGEMLVQGMISPDNFLVDKKTLAIKNFIPNNQSRAMFFEGSELKEVDLSADKIGSQIVSDEQVKEIAKSAIDAENHYKKPQDIEWAIENGELYVVQSRPITTLSQ